MTLRATYSEPVLDWDSLSEAERKASSAYTSVCGEGERLLFSLPRWMEVSARPPFRPGSSTVCMPSIAKGAEECEGVLGAVLKLASPLEPPRKRR